MDRFGASVRARRRGEEVPEDGYPGPEIAEVAAELDVDPDATVAEFTAAAVPAMFARIKATLARLRIDVDIFFSERELHDSGAIERAIARARTAGHVFEAEGATWLATAAFGDDKDRVILRADGRPTYFAADLAYVEHKFARGSERLIYILGADHHGYVSRLKAAAASIGYDPDAVEVPLYQMVTVSGERMGKRRGNAVTADELLTASASTPRATSSSSARTTRCSTSTSTSPSRRARRTLSTTSSTRTPGRARSCGAARRPGTPCRWPRRGTTRSGRRRTSEAPGRVAGRGGGRGRAARAPSRRRLRARAGRRVPRLPPRPARSSTTTPTCARSGSR